MQVKIYNKKTFESEICHLSLALLTLIVKGLPIEEVHNVRNILQGGTEYNLRDLYTVTSLPTNA